MTLLRRLGRKSPAVFSFSSTSLKSWLLGFWKRCTEKMGGIHGPEITNLPKDPPKIKW